MEKMLPLTLEDKDERACFARNAKAYFEEAEFWISAVRENQLEGKSAWCLQKGQQPLDINAANLQVTLVAAESRSAPQSKDETVVDYSSAKEDEAKHENVSFIYVSNLTDEILGLKEQISVHDVNRKPSYTFACKVSFTLILKMQ